MGFMKSIFITCLLVITSVLMTSGQEKPKVSDKPITSPTPAVNLALTDAETKEGLKIQKELEDSNVALEEILMKTQGKISDPDLLVRAAAAAYTVVLRNRVSANAWFVAAQKAHNCTGCLLEKGVFVKPTTEEKK